ncbi:MAG TPA: sensor histidine kinase [Streptosporangiaceae bacterium]
MSTNSSAAGPPRPPALLTTIERHRLGLAGLAVIACLTLIALLFRLTAHAQGPGLDLALLPCVPLAALGRRWPLPVLGLATALAVVSMGSGSSSLGLSLILGVAAYIVAAGLPRRSSIRAVVAAATALGGALAFAGITRGIAPLAAEGVVGLLPLAAAWFIGDSVAARRRYVAGLAEQAERERAAEAERARQGVREERVRIARELHDVIAHTLTVITVQAGVGRRLMEKRPEEARTALESIEMIGRTAQDELRVALGLLRGEEAETAALAPAPGLVDLKELADTVHASGTHVELRASGTDGHLSPALELTVYRVVQEALTNVVRHAPGARATVDVAVSATEIRIEVRDDGGPPVRPAGTGARPVITGTGHGIVGMRERIGAFGGWLVAGPLAGGGFHVLAEVPVEATV